mmetsp:Transcript_17715/g.54967  ORF Transcript_17715/g.54967 Transcript_17715/m.54967 type:complete len:218 (-) Transcript_17715:372-1025(-)
MLPGERKGRPIRGRSGGRGHGHGKQTKKSMVVGSVQWCFQGYECEQRGTLRARACTTVCKALERGTKRAIRRSASRHGLATTPKQRDASHKRGGGCPRFIVVVHSSVGSPKAINAVPFAIQCTCDRRRCLRVMCNGDVKKVRGQSEVRPLRRCLGVHRRGGCDCHVETPLEANMADPSAEAGAVEVGSANARCFWRKGSSGAGHTGVAVVMAQFSEW